MKLALKGKDQSWLEIEPLVLLLIEDGQVQWEEELWYAEMELYRSILGAKGLRVKRHDWWWPRTYLTDEPWESVRKFHDHFHWQKSLSTG